MKGNVCALMLHVTSFYLYVYFLDAHQLDRSYVYRNMLYLSLKQLIVTRLG